MTHDESIALIKSFGAKFTPELKAPEVPMPFDGDYSQEKYATQMLQAYKAAGIPPEDVFAQSFDLADVLFWMKTEPAFGRRRYISRTATRSRVSIPPSPRPGNRR